MGAVENGAVGGRVTENCVARGRAVDDGVVGGGAVDNGVLAGITLLGAASVATAVDGPGAAVSSKHAEIMRAARTNQKTRLLTLLIINALRLSVYGS